MKVCKNKTYANRRKAGLCAACGKEPSDTFRCGECQHKSNKAVRACRKRKRNPDGDSLRAFACRISGSRHGTIIHARSPGQAKVRFWRQLDGDFRYTSIRIRCLGEPVTTEHIRRNADYRGVPFVTAGMGVIVGDVPGVIVGVNSSSNWDVLFDEGTLYSGLTLNCHPHWEIAYLDADGTILADFRTTAAQPRETSPC